MVLSLRKNYEKRKNSIVGLIVFGLFLMSFLFSWQAHAAGISPVRLQVPVEKGQFSREFTFYLSRADVSEEERFTLTANQPFIDLMGKDVFVMPKGERIVPATFRVDAKDLEFGEYRANIRFVPIMETNEPGLSFIVAVSGDVVVNVVEDVPEIVEIIPEPVNPFQLRDLTLKKNAKDNDTVEATFSVINAGPEALKNGTYTVSVKKSGLEVASYRGYIEALEPGTSIEFVEDLGALDPGMYEVVVFAETQDSMRTESRSLSFSVSEQNIMQGFFFVWLALGILVVIAGLALLIKKPTRL